MTHWVELDPAAHRGLRVITNASARFGDDIGVLSVLPCEYGRLLAHYPILFRKSAQTGRFEPAALLGFSGRENLFLSGDRWDAEYVPLQVQRQPFTVLPPAGGEEALRIAFDAESPRVMAAERAPEDAQALFTDQGQPSAYLQRIAGILRTFTQGAIEALDYAAALAELDLIEPVSIDAQFVDGSKAALHGLYTIDPDRLRSLRAEALVSLRDRGYLQWAYFQLASQSQLGALVARRNRRLTGLATRSQDP